MTTIEIKNERFEKIKEHFKKHKLAYSCGAAALAGAGFTYLIMRGVTSRPISVSIGDAAGCAIGVSGKKGVMSNISLISSNRQGSPSWVIRCLETDKVFTSQSKAASEMGLKASQLSDHLNGVRDHVNGFTFERIAMAA